MAKSHFRFFLASFHQVLCCVTNVLVSFVETKLKNPQQIGPHVYKKVYCLNQYITFVISVGVVISLCLHMCVCVCVCVCVLELANAHMRLKVLRGRLKAGAEGHWMTLGRHKGEWST